MVRSEAPHDHRKNEITRAFHACSFGSGARNCGRFDRALRRFRRARGVSRRHGGRPIGVQLPRCLRGATDARRFCGALLRLRGNARRSEQARRAFTVDSSDDRGRRRRKGRGGLRRGPRAAPSGEDGRNGCRRARADRRVFVHPGRSRAGATIAPCRSNPGPGRDLDRIDHVESALVPPGRASDPPVLPRDGRRARAASRTPRRQSGASRGRDRLRTRRSNGRARLTGKRHRTDDRRAQSRNRSRACGKGLPRGARRRFAADDGGPAPTS